MGDLLSASAGSLLIPALCLAFMGWAVPKLLALFWPEGVKWLFALAFVSACVMSLAGAGFFAFLYAQQGVDVGLLVEQQGLGTVAHFGKLSAISALLWGPLMVLSVAGVPKGWVKEVW
ncbi:MAG: hypothetical protein AAGL89_16820 [Pseudomonadota bacterium]